MIQSYCFKQMVLEQMVVVVALKSIGKTHDNNFEIDWYKACIDCGLRHKKLNTLVKTRWVVFAFFSCELFLCFCFCIFSYVLCSFLKVHKDVYKLFEFMALGWIFCFVGCHYKFASWVLITISRCFFAQ